LRARIEREVRSRFSLSAAAFFDLVSERAGARQADRADLRLCLDDLYLAMSCARGDEEAWREFRERFFSYIRDFARRFVHPRAAADVADQVIADLWQRGRIAQYDGRSTLRTWLGAVVAHAAINAGKVERRTTPFESRMIEGRAPDTGSIEDEEERRLFAGVVRRAVAEVEPEDRLLLQLYYEQGLTLDEMAPIAGASKATLSRRLDRLRRRLRATIEAHTRREMRLDVETLKGGLDFSRLEFDLAAALAGPLEGKGHDAV